MNDVLTYPRIVRGRRGALAGRASPHVETGFPIGLCIRAALQASVVRRTGRQSAGRKVAVRISATTRRHTAGVIRRTLIGRQVPVVDRAVVTEHLSVGGGRRGKDYSEC